MFFFFFFWHRILIKESFLPSTFYDRSAFLLFLVHFAQYKTAVVETPQSALWPIQNTTKRFVAYIKTPQSALWPIQNTTKRFVAYSKRHKALCGVLVWGLTLKTGWPVYSHISHSYFLK